MTRTTSQDDPALTSLVITGKDPLILDDPGRLLRIQAGKVDVFFSTRDQEGNLGPRTHLLRLAENDRLFDLNPENGHGVLLAVGVGEAVLIPENLELALASDMSALQKTLESWVVSCFDRVMERKPQPRDLVLAETEGSVHLGSGETLRSAENGRFLTRLDGQIRYLDQSLDSLDSPLPIPEKIWLTAETETSLTLASYPDLGSAEDIKQIIASFHNLLTKSLSRQRETQAAEERNRYHLQKKTDRRRLATVFHGMAGILESKTAPLSLQGLPPLLAACMLVGRAAGVAITPDTANLKTKTNPGLAEITRQNNVRSREVIIGDDWWTADHGPLLAFRESDGEPVALIPRKYNAYDCLEPKTGERRRVDAGVAEDLKPQAVMFYRPFPNKKLNWRDLLGFGLFRCKKDLLWLFVMGGLAGALGLLTPLATGIILGTFIPNASTSNILQITLILIATAVAIALFNVIKGFATIRMEGRMDLSLQAALWDRLLDLPVPFFKDFTAGDLAVRSLGVNSIREILSGATLNAVLTLIFSSFNLIFLFYYDWQMALLAIGLTCLGAVATLGAGVLNTFYQKTLFTIQGQTTGTMLQFITGINKLRTTGTEDRAFGVFAAEYLKQKDCNFRSGRVDAWLSSFNGAFPVLVSMVFFSWYYHMRPAEMGIAEFVAFTTAYVSFQTAMLQLSMVMPGTANIIPLYQRAKPIFQTLPEYSQSSKAPGPLRGSIDVSNISFRYSGDGPLIVNNVSLRAGKGEFIALVGGSGAGKSTLLRLLLGFETPESGGVFYDNQDLKNLDVREVRRQIGVVLQNGKLMGGDIYSNIAGTTDLSLEGAWEAARKVGLAEDIENMPMQMHTMIPAGGGSLSGGQRQRLLIARAIANQPRILFFDEATSALDNQTQTTVSRSLEQLKVTRIVIAHRLSTIRQADRIYVLHLGKVAEEGTYEQLMANKGTFHQLAVRQLA